MSQQLAILIHADGIIQVHSARGRTFRLGNKWFHLADQAYSDTRLGPLVYTETSSPGGLIEPNVIPFRPRQADIEKEMKEAHVH